MTKPNAAAFTKLKSNFKKWLENEDNTTSPDNIFSKQLLKYKENPPASDESDEEDEGEEEESEAEEDEEDVEEKKTSKPEAQAAEEEGEEEEYYDEEYGEEEADKADSGEDSDGLTEADKGAIDPKLRMKYAFLFKPYEERAPIERRWKWVRKDCLPEDMLIILNAG